MKEYVDLYDNFRNKTGKVIERRDIVPKGLFRLIIHVLIFDKKGRLLIQKRTKSKRSWPNKWDLTVSGAVSSGETSQTSASRELFEELGIKYDFSNSYPNISINTGFRIDDVYIIKNKDINLKKLKLQEEEVSDAKFVNLKQLLEIIDKGEFVPYQKDYINLLFYLRDNTNLFENY